MVEFGLAGSLWAPSEQNEFDLSRIEYSDPNPELEKHPMSLEASQSSRESTRYPRTSRHKNRSARNPTPKGGVRSLEDTEWILEKIARLRGSSDAFRAQDSDPVESECVETGFGASKNRKMLRMKFWTSDVDVEKCSTRPRDPHNRIRLEKLCPEVVSDSQTAGRMT